VGGVIDDDAGVWRGMWWCGMPRMKGTRVMICMTMLWPFF